MIFSSLLFLFLFFTLNIVSQILFKTVTTKNIALLLFSLIFYGWSGPQYLLLLLGMVFLCWKGALLIQNSCDRSQKRKFLIIVITLCLTLLIFFKYISFFLKNIQFLFGIPKLIPEILLPIGISFYTFQLISYVVDVYREDVLPQKKYWVLLLYTSLFHQCIAGPIIRYQDIQQDITQRITTLPEISMGISRFTIGLAKKAILANGCAKICDNLFHFSLYELSVQPVAAVWLSTFLFSLQIYLDFSAYSDMAVGMGLMCGLHYKENFDYPYRSTSATEFWRKWNISLSTFFRDYVYIPLGGSHCSKSRTLLNLMTVWLLTGLWHGASWNFVLWGAYWGILICMERFLLIKHALKIPIPIRRIIVFLLTMLGWIFFRYTNFPMLIAALKGFFALNQNGWISADIVLIFQNNLFFFIFAFMACMPLGKKLRRILKEYSCRNILLFWCNGLWEMLHPIALLILSVMALTGNSYHPFLYFRF